MWIIREVQISEGQIIRGILYTGPSYLRQRSSALNVMALSVSSGFNPLARPRPTFPPLHLQKRKKERKSVGTVDYA